LLFFCWEQQTWSIMAEVIDLSPNSAFLLQDKKKPNNRKLFIKPPYKINPIQQEYDGLFENQKQFGKTIAQLFLNLSVLNVLAVAPTQSGKTGSMVASIYEFFQHKNLRLPKEHIFIFTGHSSLEWLTQTKARFPTWLHPHIYHRNHLNSIIHELAGMKNVLIIIDECHIASKTNQTLDRLFNECKYDDISNLYKNNIKFIQFTATPEQLQETFSEKLGNAHEISLMGVPESYLSIEKLQDNNRILSASDLCGVEDSSTNNVNPGVYENIRELLPYIAELPPSYHIIRTPRAGFHEVVMKNFKHVFQDTDYVFISEPKMKPGKFDEMLQTAPNVHHFIFIKDKLRCAKTLHHEYLGILYDRVTQKPNHSTIVQGLLGRLTGYHCNKKAVVFTTYTEDM